MQVVNAAGVVQIDACKKEGLDDGVPYRRQYPRTQTYDAVIMQGVN